jgi:hypothetical protein
MTTRPGRSPGPEEPIEWEDISRSVILQPRLPEDTPDESAQHTESLREIRRNRLERLQTSWIGCGCLAAIGLFGGTITLLLSILMLAGGRAGTFARQLVEGRVFDGPVLSSSEIWGTLVAPSLVLIVIGIPLTVLGVREWRGLRPSSSQQAHSRQANSRQS